jgi:hypothetical protein
MTTPRRPLSMATVVVAIGVIAAVAVIAWVFTIVRNEPSPIAPTPTPAPTQTVVSTPVATPPPPAILLPNLPLITAERIDRGALPDMMRYAPDRLADDSLPLSDVAQYANIEGWMSSRGIDIPMNASDPAFAVWEQELDSLAIPDVLRARGNDDVWVQTYGFRLSDVDQVLSVGQAPDLVIIMKGDFDAAGLQAAWVESGYQAVRSEDMTLWSLFPGDSVDLSAPASRPALGNMNNVVLLEDGTLIATSRLQRLEQAVRAVQGNGPSLDENPLIQQLLSPGTFPRRLDTAVILKGAILAADPSTPVPMATPSVPQVGLVSTPVADGAQVTTLPQATLLLLGLEAPFSAADPPQFSMVLSYETPTDAVQAAMRASGAIRTAVSPVTGEPYSGRIGLQSVRVYAGGGSATVVHVVAHLANGPEDWLMLIEERDLGFVMWPWAP